MLKTLKNLKKQKIISNYKLNIYGKIKKQIFKNNDILIFPSKHDSETTPLVLDECINYGIVPIAYNIGDTKSQIGQLGLVVNSFQHLNQKLLNTISNYNKVKKKLIEYKKSKLLKKEILLKKLEEYLKLKNALNQLDDVSSRYIGSHIIEQLVGKKRKIIIFDNLSTGYKKLIHKECVFVKGDLTNQRLLKKIIIQNDITSIIHLAACLNIKEAETNPKKYYKNNVLGTQSLIKACKNSNVKNIIFSSSCSVYGNVKGSVNEKIKPNPQGYYALQNSKVKK